MMLSTQARSCCTPQLKIHPHDVSRNNEQTAGLDLSHNNYVNRSDNLNKSCNQDQQIYEIKKCQE